MMPFQGGIDSLANGTLFFSAALALFYLLVQARQPSARRTMAKAGSIALLAVLAFIEGGPLLLMIALLFCAAGDAFLAHDGEPSFLGGLASFLTGHLVYVALFLTQGEGIAIVQAQPWRLVLPLVAVAGAVILLRRLLPAVGPTLRVPVTVYVVAIASMMLAAATVPAPLAMIGAALFLASDAILAIEKFLLPPTSPHGAWARPAVWILYYLAQVAITLAFLL
jgi:uncharacterized membrane protein YhhN